MKKSRINLLYTVLVVILCFLITSCVAKVEVEDIWKNATYTENTELGNGEKSVVIEVLAEEKSVEVTVHTDKDTLGDALSEHKLIDGEQGPYGLYVKVVNGILADYNTTKSYWAVNKNGEYMSTGVDMAKISDGERYEFVYTKQ